MSLTLTLSPSEVIHKINSASRLVDVFPDTINWIVLYREYAKTIHPDVCKDAGAQEATVKLNVYKEEMENGKSFKDDAGEAVYYPDKVQFKGKPTELEKSYLNYIQLTRITSKEWKFFKKYIPLSAERSVYSYALPHRAIPLSAVAKHFNGKVPQEHVNWILSRILELCCAFSQEDIVHGGINLDSIFVIPENHGIVCTSFYHMTKTGRRMTTISGKYKGFYPSYLFQKSNAKLAHESVDLELATRTAVYLLGDQSGIGTMLRKTHNNEFLNFLSSPHANATETYKEYRTLLDKLFPKQFHELHI